jgi:PAS domain S-box-containing protein
MIMDVFTLMAKEKGWSKELLYQLVESVKDYAIFVSDLDGEIVSWNIGAEKIFGYSAQEAIGQNCRMLFTKEDQASNESEKEQETAREKGCAEDERWHIRKDGSYFFASGVQTPLYDESGKHTGYAKIARDLTEKIELQEELQESKDNLEVQVRQRTGDLNESNESLRSEVIERTQSEKLRVALLRKIVTTQENERKRIARDIHDHIGQQMTGLQLKLQILLDKYEKDSELTREIAQVKSIADQIDSEVDFLAWELRPSVLDDLGLSAAMKRFVVDWSSHFNIPAEFHQIGLDGKNLLPEIEINLYRIGQEALNNISKHAKATNVSAILERRDGTVSLIIEDDGKGFEPSKKVVMTGDDRGLGLVGMKERAELVGGKIEIESSPNSGTTIYVRVPARFDEERTNHEVN